MNTKEFFKTALIDMKLPTYGVDMPDKSNSVTNAALAAFEKVDSLLLTLNSEIHVHKQKALQALTDTDAHKNKLAEMEAKLVNAKNQVENLQQEVERLKEHLAKK